MVRFRIDAAYSHRRPYLDVEPIVLVHHHERPRHPPRQRPLAALHLLVASLDHPLSHLVAIRQHVFNHRPILILLRHLRMAMAMLRVVHARVNPALKDGQVRPRPDGLVLDQAREQDVRERRQVPDVEQRLVPQIDWLGVQEVLRDHPERDEVPDRPNALELGERRDAVRVRRRVQCRRGCRDERREGERGSFEDIEDEGG